MGCLIKTLNETVNACQSIFTSYIDRLFIIANNNKQTENNFFQDVIHINISNAKTSCQYYGNGYNQCISVNDA